MLKKVLLVDVEDDDSGVLSLQMSRIEGFFRQILQFHNHHQRTQIAKVVGAARFMFRLSAFTDNQSSLN